MLTLLRPTQQNVYMFFLLQDQQGRKSFVHKYLNSLAKDTIVADQKQASMMQAWPQIFTEMVRNATVEMWDSNAYMKKCLQELEAS